MKSAQLLLVKHPAVTFSPDQLVAVSAWSARRPMGLRVTVPIEHEHIEQVVEVWRRYPLPLLYSLTPMPSGAVQLCEHGQGRRLIAECATIEEALAQLLEIEASDR